MASRTTVTLVDDLDGATADETVEFGLDRAEYEIDLTSTHADELRDVLAPYVAAARRTGGPRSTPVTTASSPQQRNQDIRAWAVEHGAALSERGRLPVAVIAAFEAGDPAALPGGEETTPVPTVEPVRGRDGLTGEERETIRAWAESEGIEVRPRGQLKKDLIANYRSTSARQ